MLTREELLKLDIRKIRSNGRFVDVNIPKMFYLSEQEIAFLRRHYNNPNIAKDVVIITRENKPRNYKVTRNDKYTGYKAKSKVKKQRMIPFIIFGTIVFMSVGFLSAKLKSCASSNTYESSGIMYEDPSAEDFQDIMNRYGFNEETYETVINDPDVAYVSSEEFDEISNRVEDLMYFCDIYQIDFNKVYNHLKDMTSNFRSDDYVFKHHIRGVTCKGEEVYANNETELLLLYARCCKQAPEKVGLDTDGLYIRKDFDNPRNYYEDIYYCSNLVGVDPCLVYGICMSESSFASEVFRLNNNPAGLKNITGDGFWIFDTPTEGIYETCLEIRKYNRNGKNTIEEIGKSYCPVDDKEDIEGLNQNWVRNVTNNTNYAREHFNELFGVSEYIKR